MKKFIGLTLALLIVHVGVIGSGSHAVACESVPGGHYCYEACDGEVVYVEPLDYTQYIFEDRPFDDLANKSLVTTSDMDYLIERYEKLYPDTAFKGNGWAFIKASNETGLDPLFFFSLSAIESGWGTNKSHLSQNNPYSLGMYGDGVHNGYKVADTFGEGIVEGAKLIYEEYYKAGQKTLYSMNHVRNHSFCDGDTNWEYQIGSQMEFLRSLLEKHHASEVASDEDSLACNSLDADGGT